jgi:hypothetical protein
MARDPNLLEAALLRTMTLLATLTAAAEVKLSITDRKAGRDPSSQESDAVATTYLLEAEDEVRRTLLLLRTSMVVAQRESNADAIAVNIRRFNDLTRIQRLGHLLQRIHQRLLSLYPRIPEDRVEAARLAVKRCHALLEADDAVYFDDAEVCIEQLLLFCDGLRWDLRLL